MIDASVIVATVVMLALLFLKIPVFASILGACFTYFAMNPDVNVVIAAQRITSGVESNSLLACPFFIMAGVFFNYTGVTDRLVDFCSIATGRMTGGLAQANILLSTIMGGMSGSSNADAAMEAKILVPAMERSGMSKAFSTVITAVSSIITPLIPPGIGMILYGTLAGASIGNLFMWGLGIGVLMCVTMIVMTEVIAKKRGYKPYLEKRPTIREIGGVFKSSWPALVLPVIIIGSIRIGAVSPAEAGGVAVIYSIILGLVWKELNVNKIVVSLRESAVSVGNLMLIVAAAAIYSWILTKEQVPQALATIMLQYVSNKYVFMLVVNLFLIVAGMLMSGTALTIILVPLLAPIAQSYGIDLVHFGMVFTYNLSLGGITPPVGTLMFTTCGVTGCKLKDFIVECIPWYGYMVVFLFALTYLPFLFL